MRRLLVNDRLSALGERTFWHDLQEWFGMSFIGDRFDQLSDRVEHEIELTLEVDGAEAPRLIIRNASYFGPLRDSGRIPTISLLQDIFTEGPMREMQIAVIESSQSVVFNSQFTQSKYHLGYSPGAAVPHVIPLPVDFSVFEPQNAMGCQQALGLPDGCICWVGASQGAAGHVKGFDIFLKIVRLNPDLHFVGVFKDAMPDSFPPNLRCFVRLNHEELVKVIGACRIGLCTSRTESQHLAGIEMGACGLPLIVPQVGTYWDRTGLPGCRIMDPPNVPSFTQAIRAELSGLGSGMGPATTREYWRKEFDKSVVRAQWEQLVKEVENADTAG